MTIDEVTKETSNQVAKVSTPHVPTIEVLCERGEFGFGGQMYHHDQLDLETAEMLIKRGYPYLKIK